MGATEETDKWPLSTRDIARISRRMTRDLGNECTHPAWSCACIKHRSIREEDDPTTAHEPPIVETY